MGLTDDDSGESVRENENVARRPAAVGRSGALRDEPSYPPSFTTLQAASPLSGRRRPRKRNSRRPALARACAGGGGVAAADVEPADLQAIEGADPMALPAVRHYATGARRPCRGVVAAATGRAIPCRRPASARHRRAHRGATATTEACRARAEPSRRAPPRRCSRATAPACRLACRSTICRSARPSSS